MKNMDKKELIRKVLIVVCAIAFIFSAYKYIEPMIIVDKSKKKNENLKEEVIDKKDDENSKYTGDFAHIDVDFEKLTGQNPDTAGWLYIPKLEPTFSYVLMASKDNRDYLVNDFDHQPSEAGVPFIDMNCSKDLTDFNTVIYGHYTPNHYLFGALYDYMSGKKHENFPYLYIYMPDGKVNIYEIFGAHEVYINNTTMFYMGDFSDTYKQKYIDEVKSKSRFDFGVNPTVEDKFVTLVCCTEAVDKTMRYTVSFRYVETLENY